MNIITRSIPIVFVLVLLISLLSITGCDGKVSINENFYKSMSAGAEANLSQMKKDIVRYNEALSKKADYEAKIKSLEPAIIDLSGYWAFDLKVFRNLQNSNINLQSITTMNTACREIKTAREALNWCAICEKGKNDLVQAVERLDKMIETWKTTYKSWTVSEYQKGIYSVEGYGLGFAQDTGKGQWYFVVTDNSSRPSDAGAQSLAQLMEKRQTYDEARKAAPKTTYNCIPATSESRRTVEFWEIAQVRNDWREGSPQVSSVIAQFPEVSKFWSQLKEIGYTPSYKGGLYWVDNPVSGTKKYNLYFQVIP